MKTKTDIFTATRSCNEFYHVFNIAIGNEKLFHTDKDHYYFLKKLERYVLPIADLYSYCLIPNHFHILIKTKSDEEIENNINNKRLISNEQVICLAFKNMFISYSKSYNKEYKRKGKLFIQPFKRVEVSDEMYLPYLMCYIHRNPIHHGLSTNYTNWKYSSYKACLSTNPTKINRNAVLYYFGSKSEFVKFHDLNKTIPGTKQFIID